MLLFGPPGSGKSLIAKCAPSLLPPPSHEELIEIIKVHSLCDSAAQNTSRPFRAPHHNISLSALLGGGRPITPGEIALAHRGALFLDELPEFSREALESLRQPLEDKTIKISRAGISTSFPTDFMLIATMNPCPCGYLGSPHHNCSCTPAQIFAYRKKLSGPLLDRIDMCVEVNNQDNSVLLKNTTLSTHEDDIAKQQIKNALNTQFKRYHCKNQTNASLESHSIAKYIPLDTEAKALLDLASNKMKLSARAYLRCIRVARTIADLEANPPTTLRAKHIAEALQYRQIIPE